MSNTPIYDELAAIHLADLPTAAQAPAEPPAPPVAEPSPQVRTGGRRRKPEPQG
ncbi:hypothetical protein [Saccharothrix coeruleofusca]|uniref:Uncharacterized protein n=1 Tax=Saccharothrix coeruleofusca TaxID=33919 RepID=A0A918ATI1_9PSEU|nr:hypothetical protein [Saccharothrix coeruleofusca]GGP81768.1 hypothetical protein GCM10010185_64680 [Saccharothrix coeruleofusca]